MKVLHLHFGKEGGAERFFVNLASAFGARGVEQRFVIRPNRSWESAITPLGSVWFSNYRYLSFGSLLLSFRVKAMIQNWQPDAVMAWMPRAARLIPNSPGPVKLTRLGDYPVHLRHFRNCDLLVGNNPDICVHVERLGWSRPTRTISNFARPVDVKPVPRATLETPDDAFLVVGAGRLVNRKGMDLLIRSVARLPDAWLWIVGDGKERTALETLADELGILGRTRFAGWVDEPIHYLASADALGMPSRHEPLGNVVLEGWHAGVPVVSTRSEGPAWFMTDNKDGLLVDIDDLDGFTTALARLQGDKSLRETLSENARTSLVDRFTQDAVVDQYLDLFANPPKP